MRLFLGEKERERERTKIVGSGEFGQDRFKSGCAHKAATHKFRKPSTEPCDRPGPAGLTRAHDLRPRPPTATGPVHLHLYK